MEYKIVKAASNSSNNWKGEVDLSYEVQKLLAKGWFIQGNLVVDDGWLYQVMVKPVVKPVVKPDDTFEPI